MKTKTKKYYLDKMNTLTIFDRKKISKENEKYRKILENKKYFHKIKLKRVVSVQNMLSSSEIKELIEQKNAKNNAISFPPKKHHFDLDHPVYYNYSPNFLTMNFKNIVNSNILKEMKFIKKVPNNYRYRNMDRNKEMKSGKVLIYKKYNNGIGLDKHVITSKSLPDIAFETKYTTDIKNWKTKEFNSNENQKTQTKNFYNFNNTTNKLNEKQSLTSTTNFINNKRGRKIASKKYKYSRENILKFFSDVNHSSFKIIGKNYLEQRKKYNFVNNSFFLNKDNYENIQKELEKMNKNSLILLKKENNKLFSDIGSIVETRNFSEKFRDPLNNSFEKELREERKLKEKKIIKLNIISGVNLLKEMDEEIEKRKIIKKKININSLWFKFKRLIIRKVVYFRHIQISLNEILNNYKLSKIPFSYPQTEELILAMRKKQFDLCCDILDKYKNIVLDFDYFHHTPLHWAAKLNYFEIIPKLIAYGASVNEVNLWGNTPLHLSATKNYYETSIFLLLYLASPFIKNNNGKKPFDCSNNIQFNMISKKIMDIHYKCIISKQKNYYETVQKEFSNFVIFEFSNLLNPVALSLIKGLKTNYM